MYSFICVYLYDDPDLGWKTDDLEFPDYKTALQYAQIEQELTNSWCEVQANIPSFQIVRFNIIRHQVIIH